MTPYARVGTRRAMEEFQEAHRLHGEPSRVILNLLGNAHYAMRDYDTAIRDLTQALALEDNPGDRLTRGNALMDAGNCPRATRDAHVARVMEPATAPGFHSYAEAQVILARCHALQGDYNAALEHTEQARTIAKGHGYPEHWLQALEGKRESIRAGLEGKFLPVDMAFGPPLEHPRHGARLGTLPWTRDGVSEEECKRRS